MDKYEITNRIEKFASLEIQEPWDCSGWLVETKKSDVKKVMLALTVTENVYKQACKQQCDMIISHHPLFSVPLGWKNIDIYCSHTNMDLADGGTTDKLIRILGYNPTFAESFVRYLDLNISLDEFTNKLRKISPNLRYVNNKNTKSLKKIAFCAGSGSEFINEAYQNGADAFVTGDLKFHTALESPIVLFDIGHFESEIMILDVFEDLIGNDVEIVRAVERSPFINIDN